MSSRATSIVSQRDNGFTLLELMVVIVIIGILAGISIPLFLNQRQRGWDAAVQSDLRNAAIAQETALASTGGYLRFAAGGANPFDDLSDFGFRYSPARNYSGGTRSVVAVVDGANTYCLSATSASSTVFSFSSLRGLRRGPCPASAPF